MRPLATREIQMTDRNDKSSQDQELGRTSESRNADRKADQVQPDAHDDGNAERAVESRPRGKTEDPDRTL
jgi:hypothetical protein